MELSLAQAKIKRRSIKASCTRCRHQFESLNPNTTTLAELELRMKTFSAYWSEYDEVQTRIEILEEEELQVPEAREALFQRQSDERNTFETAYYSLMARFENAIEMFSGNVRAATAPAQGSVNAEPVVAENRIKLPPMEIPSFSGSYDQWRSYRDSFKCLIHENRALSRIQKFHHLKASLKGSAAEILHSIDICDDNYDEAWELLNKRYNNERWIIEGYLKALFEVPAVKKDNPQSLRQLLDNVTKNLRALHSLQRPTQHWDDIVVHIITSKLDSRTLELWEINRKLSEFHITLDEIQGFLSKHCMSLESLQKRVGTVNIASSDKRIKNKMVSSHIAVTKPSCPKCRGPHAPFECPEFRALSPGDRFRVIRDNRLCTNCLRTTKHNAKRCLGKPCGKCPKKHHTLLHFEDNSNSQIMAGEAASIPSNGLVHCLTHPSSVLLSTALIEVREAGGSWVTCVALLDNGSQSNIVTSTLASRLGIRMRSRDVTLSGIGQGIINVKRFAEIDYKSRLNSFAGKINCMVINRITDALPRFAIDKKELDIPKNIKLANPKFFAPSEIDLLIGADTYYKLLCVGQIRPKNTNVIYQKTHFGWLVSDSVTAPCHGGSGCSSSCNLTRFEFLDDKVERFWQLESVPESRRLTARDLECEQHFKDTTRRDSSGRFVVLIPLLVDPVKSLGSSFEMAKRRFLNLERKLHLNKELKIEYTGFMREYEELGHMRKVEGSQLTVQPSYYMPHHAVVKPSSTTTRVRVVFDASAKTDTGISLNDVTRSGPVLQDDLFTILVRFRTFRIALTADIAKMYRQVRVDDSQTSLQRILWREEPSQDIATYELLTVTYGTTAASYLAIRAMRALAMDEAQNFPIGAEVTLRDFYVDDLITGANTEVEAREIYQQTKALLARGGFQLRKWITNRPELLDCETINKDETYVPHGQPDETRTLGMLWACNRDCLRYSAIPSVKHARLTKRHILSRVAMIFDPLGLLGPLIITAKLIVQKLWALGITWDESLPISLHTQWNELEEDLEEIADIVIPRRIILNDEPQLIQLHGFSDASELAYGACVYLVTQDALGQRSSALICAKSRVAPLKSISLPRLELCGALLLAKLMRKILQALTLKIGGIFYWTDSMIVLHWLNSCSRRFCTFVANRVGEIQDLTAPKDWRHVITDQNPADLLTRGIRPSEIRDNPLWWAGPNWLCELVNFPGFKSNDKFEMPEQKVESHMVVHEFGGIDDFITRFSSFQRLIRTLTYCYRFIHNAQKREGAKMALHLSANELVETTRRVVIAIQQSAFHDEIRLLKRQRAISTSSPLRFLNPFLDDQGVLRVGGRLRHSNIAYDTKHQILLPSKHIFVELLIKFEHERNLHAGVQATLAAIRLKYWPINAKNAIKTVIHRCVTCFKASPRVPRVIMGDLPAQRINASYRPFIAVGIDFCGPFSLKEGTRRSSRLVKIYVAVFVCFGTKAVHLESVMDLSTEGFLNAFKRFIARRGRPADVFSDNGLNFVGADRELRRLYDVVRSQNNGNLLNWAANETIRWHFIPPRAPHFGGLWEAAVKAFKYLFVRVAGNVSYRYDEFNTLLTGIEAVLNSRPLTALSSDPNDLLYLSPGHFLIGESLIDFAEPGLEHLPIGRLSRWEKIEQVRQHFWRRWQKEYLHQCQQRPKWLEGDKTPLHEGQLVVLGDDQLPPLNWLMGRITQVFPGADGLVRAANVRTNAGVYKRPATRLYPLPIDEA